MSSSYTPSTVGPVERGLVTAAVAAIAPFVGYYRQAPQERGPEPVIILSTLASRFPWANVRACDASGVTIFVHDQEETYRWEQVVSVEVNGQALPLRREAPELVAA